MAHSTDGLWKQGQGQRETLEAARPLPTRPLPGSPPRTQLRTRICLEPRSPQAVLVAKKQVQQGGRRVPGAPVTPERRHPLPRRTTRPAPGPDLASRHRGAARLGAPRLRMQQGEAPRPSSCPAGPWLRASLSGQPGMSAFPRPRRLRQSLPGERRPHSHQQRTLCGAPGFACWALTSIPSPSQRLAHHRQCQARAVRHVSTEQKSSQPPHPTGLRAQTPPGTKPASCLPIWGGKHPQHEPPREPGRGTAGAAA